MPVYKGYLPVYFKGYGIFGIPQYKPRVSNRVRGLNVGLGLHLHAHFVM